MAGQHQIYGSFRANDHTNNDQLSLNVTRNISELFQGDVGGLNQHFGDTDGYLQPRPDAQVLRAPPGQSPLLSSGSDFMGSIFLPDHSILTDGTTTSFDYPESTTGGTVDTMITDMEVTTLPAFESCSDEIFGNISRAESSVLYQSTQPTWNYHATPASHAEVTFIPTSFQQDGINSREVRTLASSSVFDPGIQNSIHQLGTSGLPTMRSENFGSPLMQSQTRQCHTMPPSQGCSPFKRIIDRLLDRFRRIESGQPLTPSEIAGLSLLIGDEYDKVSAWLARSDSSSSTSPFESIVSLLETTASHEPSTRNRATAGKAFRIVKTSNSSNAHRVSKSRRSTVQSSVRGWKAGRVPSSVFARAAELSRQILNGCIHKLAPEKIQENLQKPWDPKKPYSCPLLCGAAFKNPCDFERHEHQNRPQYGYVCNLSRIVQSPAGPCCSFCGHLNPVDVHFQVVHKNKKACRDNELQLGGKNSRIFRRGEHFKQHFKNIHRGIPPEAFLETAHFKVKNNFRHRCGFCGVDFSGWDDQMSHLRRQFKRGHPLSQWQEPWVGPASLPNCPDVDGNGVDDDTDSNDDDSSDDGMEDDDSTEKGGEDGEPPNDDQQSDRDDRSGPGAGSENRSFRKGWPGPTSSSYSPSGSSETEKMQSFDQDNNGFNWYLHFQSICGRQFSEEEQRESRIPLGDVERIALHLTRHHSSPLAVALMQNCGREMLENRREALSAFFLYDNNQSLLFKPVPTRLLMRKSLGRGGSSLVDEVRLPGDNRILAMKMGRNKDVQRLLKEVYFLFVLRHQHIVQARGFVLNGQETAMLMEPVADCSLQQLLDGPNLKSNLHIEHLGCISAALQYIHKKGIIHCDIKPSNILVKYLGPNSSWLISDFGSSQTIGMPKKVEYTRKYAAPEVISGGRISPRSDIFSLGCVIYRCMAAVCEWKTIASITCSSERLADIHLWLHKDALRRLKDQTNIAVDESHIQMIRTMMSPSERARPAISEILNVFTPFECCREQCDTAQRPLAPLTSFGLDVATGVSQSSPSPKSADSFVEPIHHEARVLDEVDKGRPYYMYQPLDKHHPEIRLLRFPPPKDGLIKCEICITSLDANRPMAYEALSYAWGVPDFSARIWVNEKLFRVTENLHKALQALQIKESPRTLWIDAICINQEDLDERNSQVNMMRKIYMMATSVIIWLGDPGDLNSSGYMNSKAIRRTHRKSSQLEGRRAEASDVPELCIDLPALLSSRYFERTWVLQEMVLAQQASVQCGEWNVDWYNFAAAVKSYFDIDEQAVALNATDSSQAMDDVFTRLNSLELVDTLSTPQRKEMDLLELLERTWNRQASDPRDKVYALMGLVPNSFVRLGLRPDYRKSVVEVYTEFAIALLQDWKIDLLSFCEPAAHISELPSWVPDFSLNISPRISMPSFSAGSGNRSHPDVLFCDRASGLLHIGGVLFDSVDFQWHGKLDSQRGFRGYKQFFKKMLGYESESSRQEARWRTLVADHAFTLDGTHQRATRRMEHGYRFWLDNDIRYEKEGAWYRFIARRFNRVVFATIKGYVGLGPQEIQSQDSVVVLAGARVPFILRRNDNGTYRLIGECYVHGIMDGEVMASNPEIRTYRLQ